MGLCEHLRACERCVYLCEHEQWSKFSCKQRALEKMKMASSEHFRRIQVVSSELFARVVRKFSASRNLSYTKTEQ